MQYKKLSVLIGAALFMALSPVVSANSSAQNDHEAGRFIVTFENSVREQDKGAARAVGAEVLKELPLVRGLVVAAPNSAAAQRLSKLPGVAHVEADVKAHILAPSRCTPWPVCKDGTTTVPEQPSQILPWGVARIGAQQAWSVSRGAGVKVAVIDTGIDRDHPDLIGNLAGGVNFVKRSSGPSWKAPDATAWDDNHGHGTHVAGTIAAKDNTTGVVGVAPDARVYGVKVLASDGSGYVSDIISGIEWSVANNIDVINMSLGLSSHVQALQDAVDAAYRADVLIVAAAGNVGDGYGATNEVSYPAKYDSVIAVAATDSTDKIAYFSSDGAEVELAAPGVDVVSTLMGGGYGAMNGTSMATPHVAGVAAAMRAGTTAADTDGNGSVSASEVRLYLRTTADDLGTTGQDVFYGYGLIDANEAVISQQTF